MIDFLLACTSTTMANLNNPFKCEICDKEFKSNNGLKNHFNIVHKLMKERRCNICQKVFKLTNELSSHVKFKSI